MCVWHQNKLRPFLLEVEDSHAGSCAASTYIVVAGHAHICTYIPGMKEGTREAVRPCLLPYGSREEGKSGDGIGRDKVSI